MFILVSREGTMFGKCFFTPITEIKTLLIFRCCRSYFRLWCSFALALRVRLILILKDNTQIIHNYNFKDNTQLYICLQNLKLTDLTFHYYLSDYLSTGRLGTLSFNGISSGLFVYDQRRILKIIVVNSWGYIIVLLFAGRQGISTRCITFFGRRYNKCFLLRQIQGLFNNSRILWKC